MRSSRSQHSLISRLEISRERSTKKTLFLKPFRGLHLSACQTIPEMFAVSRTNDVRYSEIIVMGWKYLNANLGEEKETELVQELIERMAEGNVVHQANGLRFGLYNALRQRGMGDYPFARLRCSKKNCANHARPLAYTDLGDRIYCAVHRRWSLTRVATPGVMECTECGHARKDRFTWCQGCRRMFQ